LREPHRWRKGQCERQWCTHRNTRLKGARERVALIILYLSRKIIHRTGIEPVPLAWKASMITTSPSVFSVRDAIFVNKLTSKGRHSPTGRCVPEGARLSILVVLLLVSNSHLPCPSKRSAKAHYVSRRITRKATPMCRLKFARPLPTIHGAPLALR
jgi:hypothetical protein